MGVSRAGGPDVSVVVISHNDAGRLLRAVGSVLRQTLRHIEVIVVDDASTDDTERVARRMRGIRYIRRDTNSGGCGAPRNDGLDAARAPYIMFLDSDDELPRHACKSLLAEIERTGADFVTGQISRLFEATGRTARYYPSLFQKRRVVEGIRAEPEMFLDSFSTNKLYSVDFLRRWNLRFREDLHYEDHVFTADLYCAASRFAVVPWPVYLWHREAGAGTSISLSLKDIDNVRHRILAAQAADHILRRSAVVELSDLVAERQHRFIRQDLRVYLNAAPSFDVVWAKEFVTLVRPYLQQLEPGVLDRAEPMMRVCCRLILANRIDDLRVAARSLTGAKAAPRAAVSRDGRTYWGGEADPELDITRMRLAELPFAAARIRHEVTEASVRGSVLSLTIRTFDPFAVLDRVPAATGPLVGEAVLMIGPRHRVRLSLHRPPEGDYLSHVDVDLAEVKLGVIGWDGYRDPRIGFTRADGQTTSERLLVDPSLPPMTLSTPGHQVTVRPDGTSAILRIVWRRTGLRRHAPRLLTVRRRLLKRIARHKPMVYKGLVRVLPQRRDLVLFEADCGKGYTGHPRYIYEEIRRRKLPLKAVWSVSANPSNFPSDVTTVRRMSWRYLWTMARAGWWVDSHGLPLSLPKPAGTRYLQTWHGQTIKTVGLNSPDLRGDFAGPREQWRANVARWDALVSPGAEFERVFIPSNEYAGRVLRYGSPRCDVLVHGDADAVRRAGRKLDIPADRKVLLYAPTYRDRSKYSGRSVRVDLEQLAEELGDEWVMLLRTHPVERFTVPEHLRHFVRPAGSYPEINDLMLAADALLTDYSSVMCDYAITGKPIILFIDDWEEYRRAERGLNYDLPSIAPGPCVTTTEELVQAMRALHPGSPTDRRRANGQPVNGWDPERYAAFRRMWCADEAGHAAAHVVDAFFHEFTHRFSDFSDLSSSSAASDSVASPAAPTSTASTASGASTTSAASAPSDNFDASLGRP